MEMDVMPKVELHKDDLGKKEHLIILTLLQTKEYIDASLLFSYTECQCDPLLFLYPTDLTKTVLYNTFFLFST